MQPSPYRRGDRVIAESSDEDESVLEAGECGIVTAYDSQVHQVRVLWDDGLHSTVSLHPHAPDRIRPLGVNADYPNSAAPAALALYWARHSVNALLPGERGGPGPIINAAARLRRPVVHMDGFGRVHWRECPTPDRLPRLLDCDISGSVSTRALRGGLQLVHRAGVDYLGASNAMARTASVLIGGDDTAVHGPALLTRRSDSGHPAPVRASDIRSLTCWMLTVGTDPARIYVLDSDT